MLISKVKMMNKRLYIVEGEIEKRFLEQLRECNIIKPGRVKKWKMMHEKLTPRSDILTKRVDEIIAVIDIDCCDECHLNTFTLNIKELKKIGKVFVLVQNRNFEDELLKIFNFSTISNLCIFFNIKNRTRKDLKTFLSKSVVYKDKINKENIKMYGQCYSSFNYEAMKINFITGQKL